MTISIRDQQALLKDAGFDPGPIDGLWGRRTAAAYEAWRERRFPLDSAHNMEGKTSEDGRKAIIKHEGVRLKAYPDPGTGGEPWTIGVGHTSRAGPPDVRPGMTITREEADEILAADLNRFEKRVHQHMGNVPQHVFDGAVSFDFNTGRIHNASWVRHFKAGDMERAENSLKQWNKAGGRIMRGLVNRRKEEADLIFRGIYPA